MRGVNLVKFTPRVRPARHFVDRAAIVKMMKSGVGIRLQSALEVLQVLARMFALAIFRVSKPYGWRSFFSCGPFIADVSPQAAGLGLASGRRQQRHGDRKR